MHDWGFVAAGYVVTGVTLLSYRWRLAVRVNRAHRLISALTGRPRSERRR